MPKTLVQQQFGENAERYVHSEVHAQGQSLALMVALASPEPHWLALDVAPGRGPIPLSPLLDGRLAWLVVSISPTRCC